MKKTNIKKYNDIFHYLEMKFFKDEDKYDFIIRDEKNPFKTFIYKPKEFCYIPDPSLDVNFKAIFLNKPERFENFLNSIYFIPNTMQISNLVFLIGDVNIIGQKYNINCLRADIACKGNLKIKSNNKKEEKDKILTIDFLNTALYLENLILIK